MEKLQSVGHEATKSLKWSALTELITRIAQPLIFVILARLLTPEEFGVIGTALIVISFSQMICDAGLGKALVQTKIPPERAANVVFWVSLILSLAIYAMIVVTSPWIASFFDSPASEPVLVVLGLNVIILSLASVQQFLFIRDLNFRDIFWAKLAMALTPAFFSIPLAFFGFGVWALVAGTLVGSFTNMIVLWVKSPWRPTLSFDWLIARRLLVFGIWVIAEGFGIWFIAWGDQFLIAKYLNIDDLGVYRVAYNLGLLTFSFLLNPFLPLLYPMFSRLQDDRVGLTQAFHKVNRVIILIALPASAGLLLVSEPLAYALFGAKWEGLGFALGMVGSSIGFAWMVAANGEVYRAMGRPDVNTKFMYFQLLIYVPAYIIGVQYGLRVFVCVKLAVCLLTILFHVWLCVRMLNVSYFYLWQQGKSVILATLWMSSAVWLAKEMLATKSPLDPAINVTLVILIGIIVYAVALWRFDRPFVLDTKRIVLRAISGK